MARSYHITYISCALSQYNPASPYLEPEHARAILSLANINIEICARGQLQPLHPSLLTAAYFVILTNYLHAGHRIHVISDSK